MENELYENLLTEADDLYERAELKEALKAYQDILTERPDSAWAYNRIGAILAQSGDTAGAEQALLKALEFEPKLPQAHSNLGNVYFARGDYDQALEKYKTAVALNPDNPVFHQNLHAVYKKMGRISDAVAALKQSHRLGRSAAKDEAKQAYKSLKRRVGCLGSSALLLILLLGLFAVVLR